jgi:DNA mismatch repair protein MSH6
VLRGLVATFCQDWPRWQRAAAAAANLDALASLAVAAEELAAACPDVCTPRVLPPPLGDGDGGGNNAPFLRAVGLRHPCVAALTSGASFVPNDTALGGSSGAPDGAVDAPFLLLTGPNMGGKSTLLRQVRVYYTLHPITPYTLLHPTPYHILHPITSYTLLHPTPYYTLHPITPYTL